MKRLLSLLFLSIYQDRQGLMWFGTYDGLNCYDGKNMSVFRSDSPASTGLTNNVIMTVSQADDNCIWCATDYTLNKFSQETFTTETYDLIKDTSLSIADVGISSRSYFYKEFSKKYGMTPKEYRDALCSDLTSSVSSN